MVVESYAKFIHTVPQCNDVCDWINNCSDLRTEECS